MNAHDPSWEDRLAKAWASLDACEPADFVARIDGLAAELPAGHAIGLFEQAAARDSTGEPGEALARYRQALEAGLEGIRRRRAIIQMASSLRNVGQPREALALLEAERTQPGDELDQAVDAFLALVLTDLGREREAVGVSLAALSTYLPRYNRSLARYAAQLTREVPYA